MWLFDFASGFSCLEWFESATFLLLIRFFGLLSPFVELVYPFSSTLCVYFLDVLESLLAVILTDHADHVDLCLLTSLESSVPHLSQ